MGPTVEPPAAHDGPSGARSAADARGAAGCTTPMARRPMFAPRDAAVGADGSRAGAASAADTLGTSSPEAAADAGARPLSRPLRQIAFELPMWSGPHQPSQSQPSRSLPRSAEGTRVGSRAMSASATPLQRRRLADTRALGQLPSTQPPLVCLPAAAAPSVHASAQLGARSSSPGAAGLTPGRVPARCTFGAGVQRMRSPSSTSPNEPVRAQLAASSGAQAHSATHVVFGAHIPPLLALPPLLAPPPLRTPASARGGCELDAGSGAFRAQPSVSPPLSISPAGSAASSRALDTMPEGDVDDADGCAPGEWVACGSGAPERERDDEGALREPPLLRARARTAGSPDAYTPHFGGLLGDRWRDGSAPYADGVRASSVGGGLWQIGEWASSASDERAARTHAPPPRISVADVDGSERAYSDERSPAYTPAADVGSLATPTCRSAGPSPPPCAHEDASAREPALPPFFSRALAARAATQAQARTRAPTAPPPRVAYVRASPPGPAASVGGAAGACACAGGSAQRTARAPPFLSARASSAGDVFDRGRGGVGGTHGGNGMAVGRPGRIATTLELAAAAAAARGELSVGRAHGPVYQTLRRRPSESARLSMELDPHVLADDELAEGGAPDNSAAVITALLVGSGPPSPLRSADRHRASGFAPPPTPADGQSPRAGRRLASAGACSADGDGVGPALQCAWADEVDGPERLVDASVSAERRFPPERVGAFSCHGARELNGAVQAKVNQDCALVCYPFGPRGAPYLDPLRSAALTASRERTAVFCVLDGHGEEGEVVSREVGPSVCALLQAHPRLIDEPATALVDSFAAAQALLDADTRPRIGLRAQSRDSGACCTLVLLLGDELWTANLGDCRAVLGCAEVAGNGWQDGAAPCCVGTSAPRESRSSMPGGGCDASDATATDGDNDEEELGAFSAVELSFDHKVEREDELARVRAAGGQVQPAFENEDGQSEPARLFEDLDDRDAGPGLTMTRAFGDWGARSLGFSHEPEVTRRALRPTDRFLILASDGVWEFIDSALAVEIVGAMYESGQPAQLAALSLITAAANRWYAFEGPWYRDDITCVVVYLDDLLPSGAQSGDARGTVELGAG